MKVLPDEEPADQELCLVQTAFSNWTIALAVWHTEDHAFVSIEDGRVIGHIRGWQPVIVLRDDEDGLLALARHLSLDLQVSDATALDTLQAQSVQQTADVPA